jgi:HSP20 family protein
MLKLIPSWRGSNDLIRSEDVFDRFFNNYFDDFFRPWEPVTFQHNNFKVDILEDEGYYLVEADLPGFTKDDLEISYENHYLTITAQKEESSETRKEQFVRRERQCGVFSRTFYMESIDVDSIDANFKDGLLSIKIPKTTPINPQTKIPIK